MRRIIPVLMVMLATFAATTRLEISGDKLILTYSDSREPVIFRREESDKGDILPMKIDIPGTWTLDDNAPDISRNSLWPGVVGANYSYTLRTNAKSARWSVAGLPKGLTATQAGKISGKPTQSGIFSVDVTADTGTGKSSLLLPLKIFADSKPRVITETLPEASVNAPYDFALSLNDSPASVIMAGGVPEGLTLDSNGKIHGRPSKPGDYTLNITAANDAGESSSSLTLRVTSRDIPKPAPKPTPKPAPKPRNNLRISTSTLKQAFTGEDYSFTLKATGNNPATWSADKLPEGLALNPATGTISGVPLTDFKDKITFTAANTDGTSARSITLSVKTRKPKILTALLPEGFRDEEYICPLRSDGGPGITWEFRGDMPEGLSMSKSGIIAGVPVEAGRFSLNVSAMNAGGKASRRFTLRVSENTPHDYVTAAVMPAINVSADGTYNFPVSIDANIPAGSYIEWHSFPNGVEADGGNYSFYDSSGKETITVPANHNVIVRAYLEGGVSYEPVITARVRAKDEGHEESDEGEKESPDTPGKSSGCNASGITAAVIFLLVLAHKKAPRP